MDAPTGHKRLLITGAAGRIGKALAEHLGGRYRLRLLYHRTVPEGHQAAVERSRQSGAPAPIEGTPHEVITGSVGDLAAMERACAGVDAVAHMAADPRVQAPWEDILEANITGTYAVYEGAHRSGARKIIFASSNHATGYYEKSQVYTTPAMPVRPDSYYGVSKCFGEALGRYYVDAFGMSVICLRIGSFQPRPRGERQLATWISYRDTAQLVWRGIESDVPFGVYYGISGNTRAYWDIGNARAELGYAPEDDAETFATEVLAGHPTA
ncbi:MAG: NAD(P)-dependent oxidoreductase [Chloroflexota bacterium]|nr:NAD(P)-dependent oxidoreductase [Chloroflexota bacterium]